MDRALGTYLATRQVQNKGTEEFTFLLVCGLNHPQVSGGGTEEDMKRFCSQFSRSNQF